MKILHCPSNVGGNPHNLARAERELGYDSECLTFAQTVFQYSADHVVWQKNDNFITCEYKRWKVIFRVLKSYTVLHYNSGRSLAPHKIRKDFKGLRQILKLAYDMLYGGPFSFLDLKRAHKKGIITAVTYQGGDARQGDYCKKHYPIHFCHEDNLYTPKTDKIKRAQIKTVERYADLIYAVNPDLMNVLPKRAKFIPYANIDPREWSPSPLPETPSAIPHIIHAPSNRSIKGTKYILSAFERLEKEGIPFRYTLVEGMSNQEARKVYETADILIDQLLAGYYGGLAVELMSLAKPVICYMREEDFRHMPRDMVRDMPIINATPDGIYEVLKKHLTTNKHKLRDIGLASRKYVETYHDPIKVAGKLVADYKAVQEQKKRL